MICTLAGRPSDNERKGDGAVSDMVAEVASDATQGRGATSEFEGIV
jgi:hypothetical protein